MPLQPTILFVGTQNGLAIYRGGRGNTWQRAGHTLAGVAVHAIVAADAQTLLVATDGGAARQSFDGGANWSDAAGPPPEPIGLRVATAAGPSATAYPRLSGATAYGRLSGKPATLLGAGADGSFLFRSDDDGIHWAPAGMPGGSTGRVATIMPAAERPDSAWAG